MLRARTIILRGIQDNKKEEEVKELMEEMKLCTREDIEKVVKRDIAQQPWYFVTFKDQLHRNHCLKAKRVKRYQYLYKRRPKQG